MAKSEYDGVAAAFEALLDASPNERGVQSFLKPYPYVVRDAFNAWAWNSVHVKPEFSFGGDYVADFLILSAHSGAWHTILIELESPTARPFTKNGNPSKALAKGLAQLDEWNIWIRKNESLFSCGGNESIPSPHHQARKLLEEQSITFPCLFLFREVRVVFPDPEA